LSLTQKLGERGRFAKVSNDESVSDSLYKHNALPRTMDEGKMDCEVIL